MARFTVLKDSKLLALVLMVAIALSGCSTRQAPATTATPIVTEAPAPGDAPAATSPTVVTPTAAASPAATSEPTAEVNGDHLVIQPGNAASLQQAASLDASGATSFTWLRAASDNSAEADVALATENGVALVDTDAPAPPDTIPAAVPMELTAAPERQFLAWATEDQAVHVWDVAQQKEVQTLQTDSNGVTSLAFSQQAQTVAASTVDNTVQIWDTATGAELQNWQLLYWLSHLSYSPDGKFLAGADSPNFTVHIFDVASGQEVRSLTWTESAAPNLYGAYFSPDWKRVAWVARGTAQIMDVESGALGPMLSHEDFISATAWSPDGRLLATAAAGEVAGTYSPLINLWDAQTGQLLNTLPLPQGVLSLSFSPDGSQVAALMASGDLQTWTVMTP